MLLQRSTVKKHGPGKLTFDGKTTKHPLKFTQGPRKLESKDNLGCACKTAVETKLHNRG